MSAICIVPTYTILCSAAKMLKYIVVILSLNYAKAMNDAEAREKFMNHALECSKENPVEIADLEPLQQLKTPTKTEVKCLLACVYRAIGTLGADGKFDLQKGYELAEKMKDGDEKRLENGKKIADMCIKVNDETVSDGEKGCERSALMFECINKNAPPLGFKLM